MNKRNELVKALALAAVIKKVRGLQVEIESYDAVAIAKAILEAGYDTKPKGSSHREGVEL